MLGALNKSTTMRGVLTLYKRRFFWMVSLTLAGALLSACSFPTRTPSRYFQLDLSLEIEGKPYQITYNWRCTESSDFSEADARFHSRWNHYPVPHNAVKKISHDEALIFRPTGYCGDDGTYANETDGKTYLPDITVVTSISNPVAMHVFSSQRTIGDDMTLRLKSGVITRLDKPVPDYFPSEEEISLSGALSKNAHLFQSVTARVYPASVWTRAVNLREYFKDVTAVTAAPRNGTRSDPSGRNNFFPAEHSGLPRDDSYVVPLKKVGTEWRIDERDNHTSAYRFYISAEKAQWPRNNLPPALIVYDGVPIEVFDSREVFDPSRQLLMQFVNGFTELPKVGPQR